MANALLSTVNAARQRQPMCIECEKSLPNQIVFDKIEKIIRFMQDEQNGLPVKTAKSFMSKIPSVFTGTDLIQWMMKNLKLEDQQEAMHLANLIASHGYIFPIEDHTLSIKNDCTFYRFQTPCLWPSNNSDPENTDYAVYLCKRTMQGKTRLELADYEAENLARLQKMFSRKWEFIFMQAESQAKVDKKRDKLERKVLDSQERAFWDVYRPVPGCVNTTELDIKKACRLSKSAKRCGECQKVASALQSSINSNTSSSSCGASSSKDPNITKISKTVQILEEPAQTLEASQPKPQRDISTTEPDNSKESSVVKQANELPEQERTEQVVGVEQQVTQQQTNDTISDRTQTEIETPSESTVKERDEDEKSTCKHKEIEKQLGFSVHQHHQHQHHRHHHHHHHPHAHQHGHHRHHHHHHHHHLRQCPHHKQQQQQQQQKQSQVSQSTNSQLSIPAESMLTATLAASGAWSRETTEEKDKDVDANNNQQHSRKERQLNSQKRSIGSVDRLVSLAPTPHCAQIRRKSECSPNRVLSPQPATDLPNEKPEKLEEISGEVDSEATVTVRPGSACCSLASLEKPAGVQLSEQPTSGQRASLMVRKSSLNLTRQQASADKVLEAAQSGNIIRNINSSKSQSSSSNQQRSPLKLTQSVLDTASGSSLASYSAAERQNIGELERELEALKVRLDRRIGGVKMSKVTQSYLSYFKQWAEYDPFIAQPIPSNPWISDSTELWDSERQTKDVHCRRVRRWAFSLKELLSDPAGREQFHRFLEKEFSAENLKFWDAVQDLKRVHSRDVARRVEAIWTEYLAPDANCPINIDSKSYETSKKNMAKNKNNRSIFDEAAGHVYQLMKNDSYPRYLRSDMYKDYKEASEKKRNQQAFDVFKPQITTLKHKFNF